MATLIYEISGVKQTITGVDLDAGVEIEGIDKTNEWVLSTKDDTPRTYTTEFTGGRPDDR